MPHFRRELAAAVRLGLLLVFGCTIPPITDLEQRRSARLTLTVPLDGAEVSSAAAEVTAPDIGTVTAPLAIASDTAWGIIDVPVGGQRLVTAHAYNPDGIETHRGAVSVRLRANSEVVIAIAALIGIQPINASVRGLSIELHPARDTLTAGDTSRVAFIVRDASGTVLPDAAVSWASAEPWVLTVDSTGLVTALRTGTGRVFARYSGASSFAQINVR